MFKYEFSACPVSHVCDQSCLSSVLRLMMVNSVAVDACCGFVHCCLLFSSVVQCCLIFSSVVFNVVQCPVLQLMVDCGFMFNLPLAIALLASHCNLCHNWKRKQTILFAPNSEEYHKKNVWPPLKVTGQGVYSSITFIIFQNCLCCLSVHNM